MPREFGPWIFLVTPILIKLLFLYSLRTKISVYSHESVTNAKVLLSIQGPVEWFVNEFGDERIFNYWTDMNSEHPDFIIVLYIEWCFTKFCSNRKDLKWCTLQWHFPFFLYSYPDISAPRLTEIWNLANSSNITIILYFEPHCIFSLRDRKVICRVLVGKMQRLLTFRVLNV